MNRRSDSPRRLGRRAFATALGFGAIAAPFLRLLGPARVEAGGARPTRRLLVMFTPNGTVPSAWFPSAGATERDFRLGPILEPLAAHRDRLLVLQGVSSLVFERGPGDEHDKGPANVLTGRALREVPGCDAECPGGFPDGPSLDQVVATHLGAPPGGLRSLELGAAVGGNEIAMNRINYDATGRPLPPEGSPLRAYARVFGGFGFGEEAPEPDPAALREQLYRRSVLDANIAQLERLRTRLASSDRIALERHLTTLRELELRLASGGGVGAAAGCGPLSVSEPEGLDELVRQQTDVMSMALTCGLTQVGTLLWLGGRGNASYPFDPVRAGEHHDLSHEGAAAADSLIRIDRWYASQLARVLDGLVSTPEGDATMLDHTLVMWVNELGEGQSHTPLDIPYLLAGNVPADDGRPHFRTGRHLRYPSASTPSNDLLLSVAQAFGVPLTTFGDRDYSRGPLDGLV